MNDQLPLFTLEGHSGEVISERPYVKLLSDISYIGGEWRALAQVGGTLALVEVRVKEYDWRKR